MKLKRNRRANATMAKIDPKLVFIVALSHHLFWSIFCSAAIVAAWQPERTENKRRRSLFSRATATIVRQAVDGLVSPDQAPKPLFHKRTGKWEIT